MGEGERRARGGREEGERRARGGREEGERQIHPPSLKKKRIEIQNNTKTDP